MRFIVGGGGEIGFVGGHQRQVVGVGKINQQRFDFSLKRCLVALQLNIEAITEGVRQLGQALFRHVWTLERKGAVYGAGGAACESDDTAAMRCEIVDQDMGAFARLRLEKGRRTKLHQIGIALFGCGKQNHIAPAGMITVKAAAEHFRVAKIYDELNADDRLNSGFGQFFGKFQRTEQVVGVGNGQSGLMVRRRHFIKLFDGERTFAQRIGAVDVKMNKADGGLGDDAVFYGFPHTNSLGSRRAFVTRREAVAHINYRQDYQRFLSNGFSLDFSVMRKGMPSKPKVLRKPLIKKRL